MRRGDDSRLVEDVLAERDIDARLILEANQRTEPVEDLGGPLAVAREVPCADLDENLGEGKSCHRADRASGIGVQGSAPGSQQGIDVFAICNNRALGPGAPTTLRDGATIDVFWAWFARTQEQIQQHIDNANYEVRVNGVLLENWRDYQTDIRPAANNQYVVYWYVPYGPLTAGDYEITYQVTWTQPISDGFDEFGPGTENPFEQGNCNFTVRE